MPGENLRSHWVRGICRRDSPGLKTRRLPCGPLWRRKIKEGILLGWVHQTLTLPFVCWGFWKAAGSGSSQVWTIKGQGPTAVLRDAASPPETGFILFPRTSASLVPRPKATPFLLPPGSWENVPTGCLYWGVSELSGTEGWVWIGKGPPRLQRIRKGKVAHKSQNFWGLHWSTSQEGTHFSDDLFTTPPASLLIVNPKVSGSQLPLESVYFLASLVKTTVTFYPPSPDLCPQLLFYLLGQIARWTFQNTKLIISLFFLSLSLSHTRLKTCFPFLIG